MDSLNELVRTYMLQIVKEHRIAAYCRVRGAGFHYGTMQKFAEGRQKSIRLQHAERVLVDMYREGFDLNEWAHKTMLEIDRNEKS